VPTQAFRPGHHQRRWTAPSKVNAHHLCLHLSHYEHPSAARMELKVLRMALTPEDSTDTPNPNNAHYQSSSWTFLLCHPEAPTIDTANHDVQSVIYLCHVWVYP